MFASHSNFTRDNIFLSGADMMKHSKIVVLAYSLARMTRTKRRSTDIRKRKGAASPTPTESERVEI